MNTLLSKYLLFFLLFFSCSASIIAQIVVKRQFGKVVDENNKPVEFALIRINNSSIFTESDLNGNFKIDIPETIVKIELVVSRIGFETVNIEIQNQYHKRILIVLKVNTQLEEVKIVKDRSRYLKRIIKRFKDYALGNTPYASACEIINENDIIIEDLESEGLVFTFKDNLKILNSALGYIIELDLRKERIVFNFGFRNSFPIFFQSLKPKDLAEESKWKMNRENAFNNSFRGFLVSLIYKTYSENYELYQQKSNTNYATIFPYGTNLEETVKQGKLMKVKLDTLVKFDSLTQKYSIFSKKHLLIFSLNNFSPQSTFVDTISEYSYVTLLNEKLIFDKFGCISGLYQVAGFFQKSGFSNMLPQDYLPEKYIK
jgi:hypothetical protein